MYKKIVIISLLAVLMLSMLAVVSAGQKVDAVFSPVSATKDPVNGVKTEGGTWFTSEDGNINVFNAHRFGKIYLTIGPDKYVGRVDVSVDYVIDLAAKTTTQHYHKMKLTFLAADNYGQTDSSQGKIATLSKDASFEGVTTWSMALKAPYYTVNSVTGFPSAVTDATSTSYPPVMHGLLQGSGSFEGYVLHLGSGTESWVQIR